MIDPLITALCEEVQDLDDRADPTAQPIARAVSAILVAARQVITSQHSASGPTVDDGINLLDSTFEFARRLTAPRHPMVGRWSIERTDSGHRVAARAGNVSLGSEFATVEEADAYSQALTEPYLDQRADAAVHGGPMPPYPHRHVVK